MPKIIVEKNISEQRRQQLNCDNWPIWSSPAETFDWEYEQKETCFILEGKVKVKTEEGQEVEFSQGDLVIFPQGLKCVWEVIEPVRKVYKFGE